MSGAESRKWVHQIFNQPTKQNQPSQCQIPTHEQQGKYQNGKFIYTQKANYMIECM